MDNDTPGRVGGDRLIEHVLDMYFILYGPKCLLTIVQAIHTFTLMFFLSCDHGNHTMLEIFVVISKPNECL